MPSNLERQRRSKKVLIDPALVKPEDAEVLEDLIVAAINDARAKSDEASREKMKDWNVLQIKGRVV